MINLQPRSIPVITRSQAKAMTEATQEQQKAVTSDVDKHKTNQHEGTTSQIDQQDVEQQAPPTSEFERPTANQEAAKENEKAATPDIEQHREEQDASQLPNEAGKTEGITEIYYYYFFIFYLIFFMGLIFESGERYLLENASYVSEPDVPTPKSKRIKKIAIRRV